MSHLSHKKTLLILLLIGLTLLPVKAYGWGNGSSNSNKYPYYGIHDIIADTAYQKLRNYNATAASWITDYYLNLTGSKWGDYKYSFGSSAENWLSYTDDADSYYMDWNNHLYEVHGTQRGAPERVKQCYDWVVANLTKWILYGQVPRPVPANLYAKASLMKVASEYAHKAVYAAGLLSHYFSDLSQFGHTDDTDKDYSHPSYDPSDRTYQGYYESGVTGDSFIERIVDNLGGYAFKVDRRVGDVKILAENFSRWINAHDGNSAIYVDKDGGNVVVGSMYRQLLTEFVNNYDEETTYLNARGYTALLYNSTLLHVSAAVGNLTQLLYSAYKEAEERASIVDEDRASTQISLDFPSSVESESL